MNSLTAAKARTMWFVAIGVLILIWSLFALQKHTHVVESLPSYRNDKPPPPIAVTTSHATSAMPSTAPAVMVETPTPISTITPFSSSQRVETDRPLILYAYFETDNSRANFEFFLKHGLHAGADFLFILNGDNKAEEKLPKADNIRYVKRANDCYDLGAFAEVLTTNDLYKEYNRFITMNASIRGPFLPYYATGCWSDMYLSRLTETNKLVGMTLNCRPLVHVQSMIWAIDRVGLEILLFPSEELQQKLKSSLKPFKDSEPVPPMEIPGINHCPHEYWKAVTVEVHATPLIQAAGYTVDSMMYASHMSEHYIDECANYPDPLYEGSYFGTDIHPFDTIFAKANRGTNQKVVDRLTEWVNGRHYSSYDYCPT